MRLFGYDIDLERYDDQLDLIRHYQKYAYIIVIVLIGINLYLNLIVPKLKQISQNKVTLKKFEVILAKKKAVLKEKENIERALQKLQIELDEKSKEIFTDAEFKKFSIYILSQIALNNNIKIESINYGKNFLKEKRIYIAPIKVMTESNFQDLIQFINSLENYPKIIRIANLSIVKKSVKPVLLNSAISLQLFILE